MQNKEIKNRIKKTVDQFYNLRCPSYIEKTQKSYIGGVLQTALHLLPTNDYYEVKNYVYKTWGYDPGGCVDGQMELFELDEYLEAKA